MILSIDKSSLLAAVGFSGATCAFIMLKNAIEQFINGSQTAHARKKSIILITISLAILLICIITIFKSDVIIKRFSKQITAITTL